MGQWQSREARAAAAGTTDRRTHSQLLSSPSSLTLVSSGWCTNFPTCMWHLYQDSARLDKLVFTSAQTQAVTIAAKACWFMAWLLSGVETTARCGTSCIVLSHTDIFHRGLWSFSKFIFPEIICNASTVSHRHVIVQYMIETDSVMWRQFYCFLFSFALS